MDIYKVIGQRVRLLRKQYGWTQKELAKKAHVSQSDLSRFESAGENLRTIAKVNSLLEPFGYELRVEKKTPKLGKGKRNLVVLKVFRFYAFNCPVFRDGATS